MSKLKGNDFVDLERTFYEIPKSEDNNEDFSSFFNRGTGVKWADLLTERRVVILSEAGSGKTAEISHVAQRLLDGNKYAFFLRLENICLSFKESFEKGMYSDFKAWRRSSEIAWFLLDSIDEARLSDPRDFERAIRHFSLKLGNALPRARIVITGRSSAWRVKADLDSCNKLLPSIEEMAAERVYEGDGEGQSPEDVQLKVINRPREVQGFRIFALQDLNKKQMAIFLEAKGIQNSQTFLDEIERADAWSFTARPQDLEEISRFWISNGKIGSKLELMENSVKSRLIERDANRSEIKPLKARKVRKAAQLLAAATTLTKVSSLLTRRPPDLSSA